MSKFFILVTFFLFNTVSAFSYSSKTLKPLTYTELSDLLPSTFEVLVWNVYKGGIYDWENDLEKISADSDIILLQEATDTQFFIDGLSQIDFETTMAISWVSRKKVATGVATAARTHKVSQSWLKSYYLEPVTKTPKITFFTEYQIEGSLKTLLVANIHAINFVSTYKFKHMIDKAVQKMSHHSGPIIFAGDFNTWTNSKIRALNQSVKKIGLKEVSFSPDLRKKALGKPLDYIWVRGLRVLDSKAHGDINSSDHKPMSAKFSLE